MPPKRIGLIGDFNPDVTAHCAIPKALALAATQVGCEVEPVWLATDKIVLNDTKQFAGFTGLWCVPASPYASMDGALWAIQFARENRIPFLGTCGGFQHALIEYARNVLGIQNADHAETNPSGENLIVSPLACSLVEQTGLIRLKADSLIGKACGERIIEGYYCRFGLNPIFQSQLANGELEFTGWDDNGEVRAFELRSHPFFAATLFQPERAALREEAHPLIYAFVRAM
jgi:CTP synthase (UTP-ammonia lyase)